MRFYLETDRLILREYTWDDSWAYSDFERFALHPFYYIMILAKQ